jgi:DNA polymerase-4
MFVSDSASVLHADLDAFFASVEQRDDPRLRGRPVIVGSGVVLAASYEAKACGVRSAMSGFQARRACPDAVVVPPRFAAYTAASRAVFEVFGDTTPLVEGISIDEAFLDVGGLRRVSGTPLEIAVGLRRRVLDRVGLKITVGIARTKFLAKVASGVAKPDGLLEVCPDAEMEFLHPLAVERLWGVGTVTAATLHSSGIHTVGQVALLGEATLVSMLGRGSGRHLHALAHNRDPRRVQVGRRRRSIGAQRALGRARHSADDLDAALLGLVDRVSIRLRDADRRGRTVILRVRFDDFSRITRSHTLPVPTSGTPQLLAAGRELLAGAASLISERGITLIGISISNFDGEQDAVQLELPFEGSIGEAAALDTALDSVRHRFGSSAVTRGVLLGRNIGLAMPMLPD